MNKPLARIRLWLRGLVIAASLLVVLAVLGFVSLPWFVVGEAEAPPVDAILLMTFDPRLKVDEYAVSLYQQGRAKKIICLSNTTTCETFASDYERQRLIELGVPAADAMMLHTPDTDCRAQLFQPMLKFVQANGWQRILCVTDPVGSRMMRRVHQPKFKAAGIEMFVSYPPAARAELLDGWWRSHWKMQRMTREPLESGLDLFYAECW